MTQQQPVHPPAAHGPQLSCAPSAQKQPPTHLLAGANGRRSQIRRVLSIEFVSRWWPSGLTFSPVVVLL